MEVNKVGGAGPFDCRCENLTTKNPGANRLGTMDFRFLPTVGMTGRGVIPRTIAKFLRTPTVIPA